MLDDLTAVELDDAVRTLGSLGVVRRHDDDRPGVGPRTHEVEDPLAVVVVELARGFVGEEDSCADGESASDGCALLLAAAELLDEVRPRLSLRSAASRRPRVARRSAWSIDRENSGAKAAQVATRAEMSTRTRTRTRD